MKLFGHIKAIFLLCNYPRLPRFSLVQCFNRQ